MKGIGFIGKMVFALLMILFGVNHFLSASTYVPLVPNYLPVKEVFVYLTGVAFIAAGVALIINKKAQIAMVMLGLMLTLFAVLVWLPKGDSSMGMFLKDIALAASAWFIASEVSD